MKRLVLAVCGGFAIPALYSVIAFILTSYLQNQTIDQLVMFPVRWPILILYRLDFLLPTLQSEIALMIYVVTSNVIVYSILSYFLLWRFSARKKGVQRVPPKPPSFVQE